MRDVLKVSPDELERMLAKWRHIQMSPAVMKAAMSSTMFMHDAYSDLVSINIQIGKWNPNTSVTAGEHAAKVAGLSMRTAFVMGLECGPLSFQQAKDTHLVAGLFGQSEPYIRAGVEPANRFWNQLIGGRIITDRLPSPKVIRMARDFESQVVDVCRGMFKLGLLTPHE